MAVEERTSQATWGIPPAVRRVICRQVLELRAVLEDDFRRQLAALGITDGGIALAAAGSPSAVDQRAREVAATVIRRDVQAGTPHREALEAYIREAAFTFLNRLVGLRCMEERGLLIVDGQPETAICTDPARSASSLYWRVRNELGSSTAPREVWRETLRRAFEAVSQQVRVLFDPDAEHAVLLPLQPTLQRVVDALNSPDVPKETYAEDEVLGWVYQYYNQQEKNEVYARLGKGRKLERPEDIAAATCLYTERYMVDYLLQNTLGALWVEMHPDSRLPERWPYYVRPPEGNPEYRREPRPLREITLLDPACGSGHFLVRAFGLLAEMYAEEGAERPEEVAQLILERNLHGIDIDPRAVQIAALALYMKGCELRGPGFRPRRINLVATDVVLPGDEPPAEYMARFQGDLELEELVRGIWRGLKNVRLFGSLLHPERAIDDIVRRRREREKGQLWEADDAQWQQWRADLLAGLREEFEQQAQSDDLGQRLFGEGAAKGVSLIEALGRHHDVLVTNPPYASAKNLNDRVKRFLETAYRDAKHDIYAPFVARCRDFCVPGGYVGMVTQQSWLFLRSFVAFREDALKRTTVTTLAHLGPRAFEEISGEVVNTCLFVMRTAPALAGHRLVAFRLTGGKSSGEKQRLLRRAVLGRNESITFTPPQRDLLCVPEAPFIYWMDDSFLNILSTAPRMASIASVKQGLATGDDDRFRRWSWEVAWRGSKWFRYTKGGGYRKWWGYNCYLVDWENNGAQMKKTGAGAVRNEQYYMIPGLTHGQNTQGSLSVRELLPDSVFGGKGPATHRLDLSDPRSLTVLMNSRLASYLLRAIASGMDFTEGYVSSLPLPRNAVPSAWDEFARWCITVKRGLLEGDPLEDFFRDIAPANNDHGTIFTLIAAELHRRDMCWSLLLATEGIAEADVLRRFGLHGKPVAEMTSELGSPVGWHPLVAHQDHIPQPPEGLNPPNDVHAYLQSHERRSLSPNELKRLKERLRELYEAGPGAAADEESADDAGEDGGDDVIGAQIPVPAESFLEELSQKLEVHPISVYWLLKEMREQEGLVCPPEMRRQMEDYLSVTIIRMLGYRWPEQDAHEREHGPILDPDLVDADGIIPLVPCGDEPIAAQRVRTRLERQFGEDGAAQSEEEFRRWVGRDIGEWLRRDFFKRHVQQFKQRPIAWHFISPEHAFEAFVLYHRLSRATLQKLRTQYAGNLIQRLKAEQERAKQRNDAQAVTRLQLQIEDVEDFRARIEAIERGDELKYRIRCRWKDETENGRSGPYEPDIDDGVKVNIRPFQEAGLLAATVVKKW
jgi:hypothetical protein